MPTFDPSKFGATLVEKPALPAGGFDASKFGATPAQPTQAPVLPEKKDNVFMRAGNFMAADVLAGQDPTVQAALGEDTIAKDLFKSTLGSKGAAGFGQQLAKTQLLPVTRERAKEIEKLNMARKGETDNALSLIEKSKTEQDPVRKQELLTQARNIISGVAQSGKQTLGLRETVESQAPELSKIWSTAVNTAMTALPGGPLVEQGISKLLPSLAKTIVPKAGQTFTQRLLTQITTLPGLARLFGKGLEFGTMGAGFNAANNLYEDKPITEGMGPAFLTGMVLPFAGAAGGAALRPAEKILGGAAKVVRSYLPASEKLIADTQRQLKEAYDDVFSARESTNARAEFQKAHGKDPAIILSENGIVPGLEYTNGKTVIRTKVDGGAVDKVGAMISERAKAVQQVADAVQERLGRNVSIDQLEQQALSMARAKVSGIEFNATTNKIKSIFDGLRAKYGDAVGLGDINLERIASNDATKAWNTAQFDRDAYSLVGDIFRNSLDAVSGDTAMRRVNAEIGDLIAGRDMLLRLDGKGIGGGRFTNIVSSATGAILATVGAKDSGTVLKLISGAMSAVGVKAFLRILQRQKFGGAATERILSYLSENRQLLDELLAKESPIVRQAWEAELKKAPLQLSAPLERKNILPQGETIKVLPAEGRFEATNQSRYIQNTQNIQSESIAPSTATQTKNISKNSSIEQIIPETTESVKPALPKSPSKASSFLEALKDESGFAEVFKDSGDLTTKVLKKLEGRSTVSRQFIEDLTNSGDLKQAERDLIRKVLSESADSPLAAEARKYKTAEEFVKAKGNPVYHGTLAEFDNFDAGNAGSNTEWKNAKFGTFFLDDATKAKEFPDLARMPGDNRPVNVKEVYIDLKNPIDLTTQGIFNNEKQAPTLLKILGTEDGKPITNPKKALKYLNDNVDLGNYSEMMDEIYANIKNKKIMQDAGFDGIISDYGDGITEKVVFDTAQIKTKSQLTDIWNKAQKGEINVSDFAAKVKTELLPLKTESRVSNASAKGTPARYESISLPDELRGPVANYEERIYQSPIKTSAGDVHFSGEKAPNYFAHTRIEDLPSSRVASDFSGDGRTLSAREMRDLGMEDRLEGGTTRRVIEIQSDLFQKGRLENEMGQYVDATDYLPEKLKKEYDKATSRYFNLKRATNSDVYADEITQLHKRRLELQDEAMKAREEFKTNRSKELAPLEPYRNTWHERIIREEIKQAAKDGKTKLQFPTGETAMKIEGLGDTRRFGILEYDKTGEWHMRDALTKDNIEVGKAVMDSMDMDNGIEWIITDVLGDGKFKAIPKDTLDNVSKYAPEGLSNADKIDYFRKNNADRLITPSIESFDISGKVDTSNPIYKFYEKDVQKYLTNKYGGKRVKDAQGVEWIEIDVKPEQAKMPIEAFGATTPGALLKIGGGMAGALTALPMLAKAQKYTEE